MRGGWWTVFRWRGTAFRLHWSLLAFLAVGLLLASPGLQLGAVGLAGLILIHELGHAWVVRRVGAWVDSVDVGFAIGFCRWRGNPSPLQRAAIAWGGIGAQAILLVVGVVLTVILHPEPWSRLERALELATIFNFMIMVMNLIPVRYLDGWEAWEIVPLLWKARRRRRPAAPKVVPARPRDHLRVVDDDDSDPPPTVH